MHPAWNNDAHGCDTRNRLHLDILLSPLVQLLVAFGIDVPALDDIQRCCLQGAVAALHGRKLVCLSSAAGSPKLDLAMSLDIQATAVRCLHAYNCA